MRWLHFQLLGLLTSLFLGQAAQGASIVDIYLGEKGGMITAGARLSGALPDKTAEAVMSGMPVTFTYEIRMVRARGFLWNDAERTLMVHKTVKYDSISREFNALEEKGKRPVKPEFFDDTVRRMKESRSEEAGSSPAAPLAEDSRLLTFTSWTQTEEWIRELKDAGIEPKNRVKTGEKYYVEIKAESLKIKLIPPFNILLFFLDLLNFDTAWERSSPFILEPAPPAPSAAAKEPQS